MKTFNIIGCCILRDIFRLNPDGDMVVKKFIQSVSPISIMDNVLAKQRISPNDLIKFNSRDFDKRNFCINFNKSTKQIIEETPTDYILLDLAELRFDTLQVNYNSENLLITKSILVEKTIKNNTLQINDEIELPFSIVKLSFNDICSCIQDFLNWLLTLYKPSQIILVKNMPAKMQLEHHNIKYYSDSYTDSYRLRLFSFYNYVEQSFPAINIINMPAHVSSTIDHTWGGGPLHFVNEYYEYLYKCIKILISNKPTLETKTQIDELENLYTKFFEQQELFKRLEAMFVNRLNKSIINYNTYQTRLSKHSSFDGNSHKLMTLAPTEQTPYAIIFWKFDINAYAGRKLTFSVKFKTTKMSLLKLACRVNFNDKMIYLASKNLFCLNQAIDFLTFAIPANAGDYKEACVMAFINEPDSSADIIDVKLEEGDQSTLF